MKKKPKVIQFTVVPFPTYKEGYMFTALKNDGTMWILRNAKGEKWVKVPDYGMKK